MEVRKEAAVRMNWADAARGVGMLAIVLGHALRGEGILSHAVYVFHVPLCIFLSGYFYRTDRLRAMGKRAQRLLVPYAVFGLVSICIYAVLGQFAGTALGEDQTYTFTENLGWLAYGYVFSNSPLWFLPCLFVVELLVGFFARIWHRGREASRLLGALCWALPLLIAGMMLWIYFNRLRFLWPWSLQSAMCLLPFAWAGYTAGKLPGTRLTRGARMAIGGILTAAGLAVGIMKNDKIQYIALDLGSWQLFYAAAFLTVCGICLFLSGACRCRPLEAVGRNSMPILLMHKFPILFFQVLCPGIKNWLASGSAFWGCATTVLSVVMCIAVGWCIQKILPEALGLRRK